MDNKQDFAETELVKILNVLIDSECITSYSLTDSILEFEVGDDSFAIDCVDLANEFLDAVNIILSVAGESSVVTQYLILKIVQKTIPQLRPSLFWRIWSLS